MSKLIKLLAIDASTDACSVAIAIGEEVVEEQELTPKAHTRVLLPMIDRLQKRLKIPLSEYDAFAFGCGPGSFTGVRIACSMIQALAYSVNKPIIPISTLRALAAGAYRQSQQYTQVMACLDARLGEKYCGLFAIEVGVMQAVGPEQILTSQDIVLPTGDWHLAEGYPAAQDIVRLAIDEFQKGHVLPPEAAEPVYLREEFVKKPGS